MITTSKRTLVQVYLPSYERDGTTKIDQKHFTRLAVYTLAKLFGGATAVEGKGAWLDGERLVWDDTIIVSSYADTFDVLDANKIDKLKAFAEDLRVNANQGEVALTIGDTFLSFTGDEP